MDLSSMGSAASSNASNNKRLNNSKHFTEVTRISEALKLYTTLGGGAVSLDAEVENEDESDILIEEAGGIASAVKNIAGISEEAINLRKTAVSAAALGKASKVGKNLLTQF